MELNGRFLTDTDIAGAWEAGIAAFASVRL